MKNNMMTSPLLLSILWLECMLPDVVATKEDCCLCDGCLFSFRPDLPAIESDASGPSILPTCEQVAFDLLFNGVSSDEECREQQDRLREVCCATPARSTEDESGPNNALQRRRHLFWDLPKPSSYLSWSSTQSTDLFKPPTFTNPFSQVFSSFENTLGQVTSTFSDWGSALTQPSPGLLPQFPTTTAWGNNNNGFSNSGSSTSGGPSSQQWVNAHNTRRSRYHRENNVAYVPVKWSNELTNSANTYTQRLLNGLSGCQIRHGFQNDRYGGENLASQSTFSSASVSAESVLQAWYENELNLSPPANGHLTQVVWRGTQYVGCAAGSKDLGSGRFCHIQTCRYLAPGNCNGVSNILQESTSCGPQCPTGEGCF